MINNKGAPPQAAAKKSMGSRAFVGAPLQPPEQCGKAGGREAERSCCRGAVSATIFEAEGITSQRLACLAE